MKLTKKQLRNLIQESIIKESWFSDTVSKVKGYFGVSKEPENIVPEREYDEWSGEPITTEDDDPPQTYPSTSDMIINLEDEILEVLDQRRDNSIEYAEAEHVAYNSDIGRYAREAMWHYEDFDRVVREWITDYCAELDIVVDADGKERVATGYFDDIRYRQNPDGTLTELD